MSSIRIIAVAAIFFLGCSPGPTEVLTDAPTFSIHGQTIPFRANLRGTAQDPSDVVCPTGSFAGKFSLSGHATELGDVAGDGSGCTAFTSPTAFVFLAANNTIVAANGDELWLTLVSGGGSVVGFDPTRGPKLAWTAEKDIIGGTGRFAGATGRVTEVGTQDGSFAPSESILEGRISRVGAK